MTTWPTPAQLLGLPDSSKYSCWYTGQDAVFERILDWLASDQRFLCLSAPCGSGKSLLAVLASRILGKRAVILTATKGLQEQLMEDIAPLGGVLIKGQNNYPCRLTGDRCDEGPCHEGFSCPHRRLGCAYYDALYAAQHADLVTSNYAYWLAQSEYSDGLGNVSLLVCDEAHQIFSILENHLGTTFRRAEIETHGGVWPTDGFDSWEKWVKWATAILPKALDSSRSRKAEIDDLRQSGERPPRALLQAYRTADGLCRRLGRVKDAIGRWCWEKNYRGEWLLAPVWPGVYSHLIFQGVPKIIVMSATLTPKSVEKLAIPENQQVFLSAPSYFPAANTPIIHVPTVRLDHRAEAANLPAWLARIDQLIDRRLDRKGIIFTVSYDRRDYVFSKSRHQHIMMSHDSGDVIARIAAFKSAQPPRVLVSPAITSGFSFDYTFCEYIIVGKVPFPDTRSGMSKARQEDDPDWTSYSAMETLVQEASRGTRAADDLCEVIVIDDNWKWWWPKYRHFAALWFQQRVRERSVPVPPPMLPKI